ncbi:hypothetical protein KFE94_12980 [bacterium SCSIO 12643]|nr:hypothetical protein KFE94_12980 [bacterium SCSIO 12643]
MIKNALDFRKKFTADFPKHDQQLNNIYQKIEAPLIELKPLEKSILTGCIKAFLINPNQDLITKSDYDIFQERKTLKSNYLKIDIGNDILKKLGKKTPYRTTFQWLFNKFNEIESAKNVYYTIANNGNILKVGISLHNNLALYSELEEVHTLEKFCFGKLSSRPFTNKGTPSEVIHLLDLYSNKSALSKGQLKLKTILKESKNYKS